MSQEDKDFKRRIGDSRMKGADKAGRNRTEAAIYRRRRAGETAKTSKKLAEMMDHLYKTHFVERYHSKN